MNIRKIVIITISVLVAAGLVAAGIFFAPRGDGNANEPGGQPGQGGLPSDNEGGVPGDQTGAPPQGGVNGGLRQGNTFGDASLGRVEGYFTSDETVFLVQERNVSVVRYDSGASSVVYSEEGTRAFHGSFSYDGNFALLGVGDPDTPRWYVVATKTGEARELPEDIQSPVWAPSDTRVAYLSPGAPRNSLRMWDLGDPDADPDVITTLAMEDIFLEWKDDDSLFVGVKSNALSQGSVLEVGEAGSVDVFLSSLRGLRTFWNPELQRGVAFSSGTDSSDPGTFYFINGDVLEEFSFVTLPQKCVLEPSERTDDDEEEVNFETIVVCAVPQDLQELTAHDLPDAYERREFFTSDDIVKINIESGDISILSEGNIGRERVDATDLRVDNDTVYFINRVTGFLQSIPF